MIMTIMIMMIDNIGPPLLDVLHPVLRAPRLQYNNNNNNKAIKKV